MDPLTAIGVGSSLLGGLFGSKSASKAADAQTEAAREAAKVQREMYGQTRDDLAPWRVAGANALDKLSFLLGTGGTGSVSPGVTAAQQRVQQAEQRYNALASSAAPQGAMSWDRVVATLGPRPRPGGDAGDPAETAAWDQRAMALGVPYNAYGPDRAAIAKQPKGGIGGVGANSAELEQARNELMSARNALSQAQSQPYSPGGEYGAMLPPLNDQPFTAADFEVDPGYQFRQQEGMRGIENSAAARGMQLSGANLKDIARFNSGLASQEYGNAFSRDAATKARGSGNRAQAYNMLSGQSASGQNAAAQTANLGASVGGNLSDIALQAGNARSAGIVGSGNAMQSGLSGASDYLQLMQLLRSS